MKFLLVLVVIALVSAIGTCSTAAESHLSDVVQEEHLQRVLKIMAKTDMPAVVRLLHAARREQQRRKSLERCLAERFGLETPGLLAKSDRSVPPMFMQMCEYEYKQNNNAYL